MTDRDPRQDPAPPPPWQPQAPPPNPSYPGAPGGGYPGGPGPGGPAPGGPVAPPGGYPGGPTPGATPGGPGSNPGGAPPGYPGGYPSGSGTGFTPPPNGWGTPPSSPPPAKSRAALIDDLVARPGVLIGGAVLIGVAVAWIGSAAYGFAHGQFETARDRLGYFLGIGDFTYAVALAVGLAALVLLPAASRPGTAGSSDEGEDSDADRATTARRGVEGRDRLFVLIFGIGGLVVAVAALVVCISDLTEIGKQQALSISDAIDTLAAIPLGLAVTLWARALLPSRPAAAAPANPYVQGSYGQYGQPYGQPPASPPPGPGQQPPFGQTPAPSPQGPGQQAPSPQGPGSQGPGSQGPGSPPPYGPPGGPAQQQPPYSPPYGCGQTPPPYGQEQPPPGYGGQPPR
jgi:hypothetical protein